MKLVDGKLGKDDETAIEELHQYLIEGEGSWALGEGFLLFVGRILEDPNISTEARVHLLRTLAAGALKDDIILVLHQDRRDHVLMNFAYEIDRKAPEEQEALALFVSNQCVRNYCICNRNATIFFQFCNVVVQFIRKYQFFRVAAIHI